MGRSSTSSSRSSSASSSSGSSSSSSGSEDAEEVRRRRSRAARKRKTEPEERAVDVEDSDSDSSTADERRHKKKKKRSDRARRLKKRSKGKRKRKRTKRPKKKRSKRKSARDDSEEESAPAPAFPVAPAPALPAPPLREAARSERGSIPGEGFERADGRPEFFERERDFPRRRGDVEYENGREERRPDERDGDRKRRRRHGEESEAPERRPRRFDEDEIRRRKRPDRRGDSAEERDDRCGAPPRPSIGRDRDPRRDRRSSFAEPMPSSGRRDENYANDDRVDYRTGRSDCGGDRAGGFRDKNENFNGRPRRQFGHRTDDRCADEREAPVRREHVAGTDRDIKQQRSSDRERIYTRDKNQQSSSFKRDGNDGRKRFSPRNREWEDENATYEWGKKEKNPTNDTVPVEKEKPNFALSGKLTEDTNTVNGVVIKYSEPPEARKPKRRWRFYPFKGDKALPILYIHRQSCFLLGRDRTVADIPLDHPSVSKQHAALQYRLVPFKREDGSIGKRVRPYIIDLGSANGTFVNNKQIDPKKYVELLERDVVKFGFSQREYVLLHENSKDDDMDDDDVKPTVKIEDIKSMVQIKSEPEDL